MREKFDSSDELSRRSFVRSGAMALAALAAAPVLCPTRLLGAPLVAPPTAETLDVDELPEAVKRVFKARFGNREIRKGHVQLDVPEVAPDGRAVPVFIETDLPMTEASYVKAIHLIVDHNPDIYLAGFQLTPALGEASIDTRIKMRRSSHVRAIAETSKGELWTAATMVYVTMNGCV